MDAGTPAATLWPEGNHAKDRRAEGKNLHLGHHEDTILALNCLSLAYQYVKEK